MWVCEASEDQREAEEENVSWVARSKANGDGLGLDPRRACRAHAARAHAGRAHAGYDYAVRVEGASA